MPKQFNKQRKILVKNIKYILGDILKLKPSKNKFNNLFTYN